MVTFVALRLFLNNFGSYFTEDDDDDLHVKENYLTAMKQREFLTPLFCMMLFYYCWFPYLSVSSFMTCQVLNSYVYLAARCFLGIKYLKSSEWHRLKTYLNSTSQIWGMSHSAQWLGITRFVPSRDKKNYYIKKSHDGLRFMRGYDSWRIMIVNHERLRSILNFVDFYVLFVYSLAVMHWNWFSVSFCLL